MLAGQKKSSFALNEELVKKLKTSKCNAEYTVSTRTAMWRMEDGKEVFGRMHTPLLFKLARATLFTLRYSEVNHMFLLAAFTSDGGGKQFMVPDVEKFLDLFPVAPLPAEVNATLSSYLGIEGGYAIDGVLDIKNNEVFIYEQK